MTRRRLLIVGTGMAGSRLAEDLVAQDGHRSWEITTVGDELDEPYNRILLSDVLAGHHRPEDLNLLPPGGFAADRVQQIRGARVMNIHRSSRTAHLDNHTVLRYDHLVLATGSQPVLPALPGLRQVDGSLHPQCFAFRTLADCRGIMAAAGRAQRAVVIGGGLLGLEAARGLLGRGLEVEILHMGPWLMDSQLDSEAGEVLARTVTAMGIQPYVEARAKSIESDSDGRLVGVRVSDGHLLDCDLVVFAAGVASNTRLARQARLAVGRGVTVDRCLTSVTDSSISAIGDCAEVDGVVLGLVGPAWEQASIVCTRLLDSSSTATYTGSRVVTRLKASGIDMAAMGEAGPMPADSSGDLEVLSYSDYSRGVYKKIVLRAGRVVGAILLGDVATVGNLALAMDRGTVVPSNRLPLLFAGLSSADGFPEDALTAPDEATLCHCNNVDHGAVRRAIDDGADDVRAVAQATRATTGCGTCVRSVQALLADMPAAVRRLA